MEQLSSSRHSNRRGGGASSVQYRKQQQNYSSNIALATKGKKRSDVSQQYNNYGGVQFESKQKFWNDSLFLMDGGEQSTDRKDQKQQSSIQITDGFQQ